MTHRFFPWTALVLAAFASASPLAAQEATDGRREVNVERYGIRVRTPQAWQLISWGEEDRAFVLRLPQEADSPVGYVACELGVAPDSLEAFLARQREDDEAERQRPQPRFELTRNALEPIDAAEYGEELASQLGQRLVSEWTHRGDDGSRWYERRVRVISDDTLYTFILATDEAHYEAYRLDFEEMLVGARFTPPQTGVRRMPGGFWMQQEYRFALRLPDGWKPAFGPSDKALFFATGASHDAFTDNLLVLASPAAPLALEELRTALPDAIRAEDSRAEVSSRVVAQGEGQALETVIHTRRGELRISILERRFQGKDRNYEVKFTCQTEEFGRIEEALRQALDSFREAPEASPKTVL